MASYDKAVSNAIETVTNFGVLPADAVAAASNLGNPENTNTLVSGAIDAAQVGLVLIESVIKKIPGAGIALNTLSLGNNINQAENELSEDGAIKTGTFLGATSDVAGIVSGLAFIGGAAVLGAPAALTLGVGLAIVSAGLTLASLHPSIKNDPLINENDIIKMSKLYDVMSLQTTLFSESRRNLDYYYKMQNSKSYRPVVDPFALDLDGDGIETTNVTSGILFDHNADGVKTGTGWVKGDDGLLVRDLNGNGTIDSGRELFGDQTMLSNGQIAANGFTALRDLDSNTDGIIDASDTAFNQLKVWRDLNQDGISQTDELQTLAETGITSINLTATTKNQWSNGNTIASTGSYTKTDGTTGTTGDVNLAINTATTQFTDEIEVPETLLDLPDMSGSGQVRDLQQAAALSPTLADLLTQYAAATTRETQLALLDQMLLAWADTSGMAGSLDDRDPAHYKVEYLNMGRVSRNNHLQQNTTSGSVTSSIRNKDNPLIDETYRNLISSWNDKIHILEAFNGSYFFQLPGQKQEGGGAAIGIWATPSNYYSLMPGTDNRQTLAVNYAQIQLDLLNSAYDSLRQAVYESLILQTRLKGYLDQIDLSITEDSISLDFSALTQSFQDKLATDPQNGLTDLIEFNKYTRDILTGTQWDGIAMMEEVIRTTPLTPELETLYTSLGVSLNPAAYGDNNDNIILGDAVNRTLYGNSGNDILLGGTGDEGIYGMAGIKGMYVNLREGFADGYDCVRERVAA